MSFRNPLEKSEFIQSALFNHVLMCSLVNSVLIKNLDKYSQIYEFLLTGDFNAEESVIVLAQFLHDYNAVNKYMYSVHGYLTFINLK